MKSQINKKAVLAYLALMGLVVVWITPDVVEYDHTMLGIVLNALVLFVLVLFAHCFFVLPAVLAVGTYKVSGKKIPEEIPTWLGAILLVSGIALFMLTLDYMQFFRGFCEDFILRITG